MTPEALNASESVFEAALDRARRGGNESSELRL